jgi:hypothetical protein
MSGGGVDRARAFGLIVLLTLSLSCGGEGEKPSRPAPEQSTLGGEVAARVGGEVIPRSLVVGVAAAQHVTPREALRRLVDDAVAASAARARGMEADRGTAWLLTAARGRATADLLMAEAKQAGPPTDAEIKALTEQYWREVDRPVTVRTVHALAQRPSLPDPQAEVRAKAVADELRAAVLGARDADDFTARAKAVAHWQVQVRVESLPAFTLDGSVSEGEGAMDEVFAKAAHGLAAAGDTSRVVETAFGWHVIRLVARLPEQRMPVEARRIAFTEEAYVRRARALTTSVLTARKGTSVVEVAASAENLMQTVAVAGAARGPYR